MWDLKYGKYQKYWEKKLEKTGKLPDNLPERPQLYPDLIEIYEVFWLLNTSRNINGAIPVSEIITLLAIFGICTQENIFIVVKMDHAYLKKMQEDRDREVKK